LRQLRALDGFVVLSEWWRNAISTAVAPDPQKLFVVNNPIDREFEAAALAMPEERSELVLLSLGVMGRAKGVFELLDAAAAVEAKRKFKLILAGPEREPNAHAAVRE